VLLRLSLDNGIVRRVEATAITGALEHAGYRLTSPRRALAELIANRRGHFTADELLEESRRRRLGVTRATIFRSLDVLADLELVERLDLPSGDHAFVACRPSQEHHHHIVCSSCGRSTEVRDNGFDTVAASIARQTGYRVDLHRLELFGLCPACRASA
jgi:Fur family ferric uptake transcriptional regulator